MGPDGSDLAQNLSPGLIFREDSESGLKMEVFRTKNPNFGRASILVNRQLMFEDGYKIGPPPGPRAAPPPPFQLRKIPLEKTNFVTVPPRINQKLFFLKKSILIIVRKY